MTLSPTCPRCGSPIRPAVRFCEMCGAPLELKPVGNLPLAERPAFQNLLTVLIALVALLGAWVGWRSSIYSDQAGKEKGAGLQALLNAEEARSANQTRAYQHYQAYTGFAANTALGDAFFTRWSEYLGDNPDGLAQVQIISSNAYDRAGVAQFFFIPRYLKPDGRDAEAHFAAWQSLEARSDRFSVVLVILAVTMWCFTLAGSLKANRKLISAGVGAAIVLVSIILIIIGELG
jgi:hypothetical protein